MKTDRRLSDLVGVGAATLKDFKVLGISTVTELANRDPKLLYNELCEKTGKRHDICALDVFTAAVAQAKNPKLSSEKCQWWYWSRLRKKSNNH